MSAKNIKKYLKKKGLLIHKFAEMLGVHPNTLSRYISGTRSVPLRVKKLIKFVTEGELDLEKEEKSEDS